MRSDAPARAIYLPLLAHPQLPARHSSAHKRRAAALQRFLAGLQEVGGAKLGVPNRVELFVLDKKDWQRLFSYPYGLPFTRTKAGGAGVSVIVIAAADYPNRLLHRWDDILLRAGGCGLKAPGDLAEFLDLMVGHEWGHAAANLSGLRTRVKWFDEFMATYLFLAALKESDPESGPALLARFVAWSKLVSVGSSVERADLGAFEYPLHKLKFDNLAWFQGVFTLFAADLLEARGWDFPLEVQARVQGQEDKPERGDLARVLLDIEPGFKTWFSSFGPSREQECS